jgi:hypothetical protein
VSLRVKLLHIFGTASWSSEIGWKFDDVVVFAILDDIESSVAIYVVPIE